MAAGAKYVARYLQVSGVNLDGVSKTATFNTDKIHPGAYDYIGILLLIGTVTGTSPTLDVTVQISEDDGANWRDTYPEDVNSETQALLAQITAAKETSKFWPNWFVGAAFTTINKTFTFRVRFVFTIGGTDTPTFPITAYFIGREYNL